MALTINVVGALSGEQLYEVAADSTWDVSDLKWEIELKHGVPDIEQRLLVRSRVLGNWDELRELCPADVHVLEVSLMRVDPVFAGMLRDVDAGVLKMRDVPPIYRADREIVLAAVRRGGDALQHASIELRDDREVVLLAVQQHGLSLKHASESLRRDKVVCTAAVESYGLAIKYVCLSSDGTEREIALAAVRQNGWAFELLPEHLKADREILTTALEQEGLVLQFAAAALCCERELVLLAVRSNAEALRFVEPALRDDAEVIRASSWGVRLHYG